MPQVDLEALVSACAGGSRDGKISCETAAAGGGEEGGGRRGEEGPPDLPPDSVLLSKDAVFDWFDRNAYYERKDSTKANSSSSPAVAAAAASNQILNSPTNSNSRRSSSNFKSKASMLGLPKPQKSCFVDAKSRRPGKAGGNAGFFPKWSGSAGKSDPPAVEPSSPKVSCMGRVRSKKEANRRKRGGEPAGRSRTGLLATLRAMFGPGCRKRRSVLADVERAESPGARGARRRPPASGAPPTTSDSPAARGAAEAEAEGGEPPGLGGMKRFTSGRKSESWANVA
ncbi:uncharacterized protein LOC115671491 [Syzygium oleosum]|uniref:uncharacterized protein LOC115671491 n=1 Tax=Syzygium oleosum TaxID=219896 RepID=UPI0011D1A5D9|nr:uncharacterized protein LOC115671491 [Syzygium oleosum]